MLTEGQAREKWCPMARTLGIGADWARQGDDPTLVGAAINRDVGPYDPQGNETVHVSGRHRCIASGCMAWRWGKHGEVGEFKPASLDYERLGYCGAFGNPQA